MTDQYRDPSNPATIFSELDFDILALDTVVAGLKTATERLDRAEEVWEELYDAVAEQLTEEYRDAGRKTDPAEHTVLSVTRRQHRAEWQEYRRAKRDLERLQHQQRGKSATINGRQSELNALREEAGNQGLASRVRATRTFGGVRA